jgi:Fe(3+) dicitrate transport protein
MRARIAFCFSLCLVNFLSSAAEPYETTLAPIVVESLVSQPALAKPLNGVHDGKIYSGKKSTEIDLSQLPEISTNNYRQAFSRIPGLITSEVGNESFASFSYRGLGDPHETFNLNILRDGLPVNADLYGYPAVYYQPPLDSIASLEFIPGGASLLYGPQIGGALNFVSRRPDPNAPISIVSKHVFGERRLYSTYNEVSGTQDDISYIGFFHRRQSDGYRNENSDYEISNGNATFNYRATADTEWSFGIDAYDSDHGEAGGLTLAQGEGLANFGEDRYQSTVRFDRLRIERIAPSIRLAHRIDSDTTVRASLYGGYLRRFSRRQSPGTAEVFGGFYNGDSNNIVTQEFSTIALDARVERRWKTGDHESVLTGGLTFYGVNSPFQQEVGATPSSDHGALQRQFDRRTRAGSIFVENQFNFGRLKITPGARLEMIGIDVQENFNAAPDSTLRETDDFNAVVLPGFGVAYDLAGAAAELYANASTGYRPTLYQDLIPLNSGDTISEDLDPSYSRSLEIGVRGLPADWIRYDVSTFLIRFEDQFGRIGTNIQNVGNSRVFGLDMSTEVNTFELADQLFSSSLRDTVGNLNLYAGMSLLNAEFTAGPSQSRTPQFAPDYIVRTGITYDYDQRFKVALLGTLTDEHFADDGNSANRFVPSYKVWDLTAETTVWSKRISILAGINNIFNENYYSRIRSNGIEPALPRNVYGGFVFRF